MEPQIQYCRTSDGVSIAYYAMGEGPPLVVASEMQWSHLRNTFGLREYHRSRSGRGVGRGLTIVRYDARGTGLSDREPIDFSWDARRADLEAVLGTLQLECFALYGHLNACLTAIQFAAENPDRVSHLVLVRPYARGTEHRKLSELAGVTLLPKMSLAQWESYTLTVAQLVTGYSSLELARRIAKIYRDSMTVDAFRAFLAWRETADVSPFLEKVRVPTLVMQRAFSDAPPLELEIASRIPGARLFSIEGSAPVREPWHEEETAVVEEFLGIAMQPASPSPPPDREPVPTNTSLRTVLFTDLASSTALTQRLGDAQAQELVRAHNAIVREALREHGGSEIKHTGDGIMASFPTASGALECTVAVQRAVAQRNDPNLQVHIGLNAGEPIAEDDDLFGTAVQLARRICDQADPAQILVSDVVRQLVAGKNFLFSDRGGVALRGFEDPVKLYEVRWRDE